MPEDFLKCVKDGGRVRTKSLGNGKYIKICYDKDGNSHSGEVMKTNKNKSKGKNTYEESRKLVDSLLELKKHFDQNYRN